MAFTGSERARIRRWLGVSRHETSVDVAITAAQSEVDGGSAPDEATEFAIRSDLESLEVLQGNMKALWAQAQALDADGLRIDVARAMAVLRAEGRRLVAHIADALATRPRRDVFVGRDPS